MFSRKMWLIETGFGYGIVSKREVTLIRRFFNQAKHTITFHTANGPTVTVDVASSYVKDLGEFISSYMLNNTPPVLNVGYRCIELGHTFIWPDAKVENYIPYLAPGSDYLCKGKHVRTVAGPISPERQFQGALVPCQWQVAMPS